VKDELKLRWLVAIYGAIALAVMVMGLLPGHRVHIECEPGVFQLHSCTGAEDADEIVRNDHLVPLLLILFAPGLWVSRRPTRFRAWCWIVWHPIVAGVLLVHYGIDLSFIGDALFGTSNARRVVETFWPETIIIVLECALALTVVALVAVAIAIKKPKPPSLPVARVVSP
jgi:hypothetical protein